MSKAAQERIERAIELYGLQAYAAPDEKAWHSTLGVGVPGYEKAIASVLAAANVPEPIQRMLLTGPPDTGKADCEFGANSTGLQTMHQGYGAHYAIKFAREWAAGERRIEIGMKYPAFDVEKFANKFKVRLVGEVAPRAITYWRYEDKAGNIYTFAPDAMGKGGYAGAVMVNFAEAKKFLRFLFSSRKHHIKDLDVGYNTLGGMGIKELDELAAA